MSIDDAQDQITRLASAIEHVTSLTAGIASTSELQRKEIQSVNQNFFDLKALMRRHTELVTSSKASALNVRADAILTPSWSVLHRL